MSSSKAGSPHRWRKCDHCTQPYQFWRSTSRYCSVNCRVAASRARQSKPLVINTPLTNISIAYMTGAYAIPMWPQW